MVLRQAKERRQNLKSFVFDIVVVLQRLEVEVSL